MEPFNVVEGVVVPIDRANVDTDAIIPKQFLKSVRKSGFGGNLFDEWRYEDKGEPDQDCSGRPKRSDFVLNQSRYESATIMLARENFGCGSSREHAVWALRDFGIRALLAPSFADIFFNNCFKNGLLPIRLPAVDIDRLFAETFEQEGYTLEINLPEQTVATVEGKVYRFEIDDFRKDCLLKGLDEIDLTLAHRDEIERYESARKSQAPWLFEDLSH